MDNADSAPAITFPNVPDDFCPTGNWQNVFQVFIDEVLSNGTILVPGLGDVTPAEINQINETLADQQNQIDALEEEVGPLVTVRYGNVTIIAGDTASIGVTFSSEMPSAAYHVSLTPIYSAGTPAAAPLFSVVSGTKTVSGFTIRIDNNIASITSLDWMAIHTEQP
jgi:hypothetical protein